MKTVLGFIEKSDYVSNARDVVSKFYELSPSASSYSRHRQIYSTPNYQGDLLHVFKSTDVDEADRVLPVAEYTQILQVNRLVLQHLSQQTYPYNEELFRSSVVAATLASIKNFKFGPFKTGGPVVLPEWIGWESVTFPDVEVKIWIESEAFENQYSDFEIFVVPPVDDVDRFFALYSVSSPVVQAVDAIASLNRVQERYGDVPETVTRIIPFPYVNVNNVSQSVMSHWGVAIYGREGDHIDSIKDAIVDYVLANSTHTQAQWEVVLPELFRRTEFLVQPRWDLISIPNLTSASALYRSIVDPVECMEYAKQVWNHLQPSYVENNLRLMPFDYKAITAMVLTGETNQTAQRSLNALFPDYLPISTSSPDFNRMTENTRQWVISLVEMLVIAETATRFSVLPRTVRRVYRNNKLYISRIYNNINYLVATRSQ